jgi:caa(3)-type oxidase subunit IV
MSSSADKPHVDRKQYLMVFGALSLLTMLEVGLVYVPGVGKFALGSGLVLLALAKAWTVGWFFMHLGHETRHLKGTVVIPFAFPALYAFVLIADAAWRFTVSTGGGT